MLAGYCGAALCAKNAVCLWDDEQDVQYCACPDGYEGDGLRSCKLIPPPCNVKYNCGLNAACVPANNNTYECACNSGFYGDGLICIEEVNCHNTKLCHDQGRCIQTSSGFQCVCNGGKCQRQRANKNIISSFFSNKFNLNRLHRKRNLLYGAVPARRYILIAKSRSCDFKICN